MAMFQTERFIEECRAALRESDAHAATRELLARAVRQPEEIVQALGEPTRAGIETLYRSGELTILNVCWGPCMQFKPHDHRMWAVIGIYGGREQNTFFRRGPSGLAQRGSKEVETGETLPLGASLIHAVANPLDRITGAIHVYGGDFFATPRSEWDPLTREERPYDIEHTMRAFARANEELQARRP
jgi:predicted metal-dependent enzyme (double-stranded beta helix superfamily)